MRNGLLDLRNGGHTRANGAQEGHGGRKEQIGDRN
jgi:hypothetical protein